MASYCTVAELKSEIKKTGTELDTPLENIIIPAVSQEIDRFCNRPDGFVAGGTATARLYAGSGTTVQWIDECVQVTKVEVKEAPEDGTYTEWGTDTWVAATGDPKGPDFNRTPYTFLMVTATGDFDTFTSGQFTHRRGFRPERETKRNVPTVRVTARWGYAATVPPLIKQACIIEVSRIFKRGESAFADALASPDMGGVMRFVKGLDPVTQQMLVNGRMVKPAVGRR